MKRNEMRKIRLENYVEVNDIANRCNTTKNNIYLIERGERNGSFDFWCKYQEAFEIKDEDMWRIIKGGR